MKNARVFVLMAGLTGLLIAIGSALGGTEGAVVAFLFAAVTNIPPALAPLAQVNPLAGFRPGGMATLLATHPPTAERVARLEAMARSGSRR